MKQIRFKSSYCNIDFSLCFFVLSMSCLFFSVKGIMLRKCAHTKGAFSADFFAVSPCFLPFISPYCGAPPPGGGSGFRTFWVGMCCWDPGTLHYTRPSSAEFCYPILD